MEQYLRLVIRLLGIMFCLLGFLLMLVVQTVLCWCKITSKATPSWSRLWQRLFASMRYCFGVHRVIVHDQKNFYPQSDLSLTSGELCPLFVCNHISYIDILVLASVMSCRFLAKQEVRHWPIIGWAATFLGGVFTSRMPKDAQRGVNAFHQAMTQSSRPLVIFPEGTTADGCRLGEFKTPYFQVPPGTFVQPIALSYRVSHMPSSRYFRKMYSWRGQWSLWQHMRQIVRVPSVTAHLCFLPPIITDATTDRKKLARECFACIQQAYSQLHKTSTSL